MKRTISILTILIAIIATLLLSSACTRQGMNKKLGGTMYINLPPGQELMNANWKGGNLFCLTRPMAEDYTPVNKTFQESSAWGVIESKVVFVERR